MDLSTSYLGFELPHPLVVGASPLTADLDTVRRLEDAGAAAIVMNSLFEEQLVGEQLATSQAIDEPAESFAEALTYLPTPPNFSVGPEAYLDQVRRIKAAVDIPVVGSLNGVTVGGWLDHARLIEEAGADALELNVYDLATGLDVTGDAIEQRTVDMVRQVAQAVSIPLTVKLSPFYTALPPFAARLVEAGADGLALFNRFYQPDIDVEQLEVVRVNLSDPSELLLRLRWLAILSGRVQTSLAVTGGVHTGLDVIKAVMVGAHAVQMVSALLREGPDHLRVVREAVSRWLEEHEYESLRQMQGSMSLERSPDPAAFGRANYIRVLHSWRGPAPFSH